MKSFSISAALSSLLLVSPTLARYGLSPDAVPLLTRTVDYTFHSICDDFHNPVPAPITYEAQELAKTILAFTNDLYTFLMGYSVGSDIESRDKDPLSNDRERDPARSPSDTDSATGLLEDLIDEIINSDRRSNLLESQMPLVKGPLAPELRKEDRTTHSYASEDFDCPQFQRDVFKFSESFKNMTYAVSEKCYRQCAPGRYYGSVSYALSRLQMAYERHYSG
ncbi:MAG: hypothetical protein Q9170_008034, partial [Blastenia crenularia]